MLMQLFRNVFQPYVAKSHRLLFVHRVLLHSMFQMTATLMANGAVVDCRSVAVASCTGKLHCSLEIRCLNSRILIVCFARLTTLWEYLVNHVLRRC